MQIVAELHCGKTWPECAVVTVTLVMHIVRTLLKLVGNKIQRNRQITCEFYLTMYDKLGTLLDRQTTTIQSSFRFASPKLNYKI